MTTNPIAWLAAEYARGVREWEETTTPLLSVAVWSEALGDLGRLIDREAGLRGDDSPEAQHLREVIHDRSRLALIRLACESTLLLLTLGVEDPAAEFCAEYERAAAKHPGMTLDADGHSDESRFYALAEEVGEVAAALTYDNAASTGHNADLVREVTQVGGLALAWLVRYQDGENQ